MEVGEAMGKEMLSCYPMLILRLTLALPKKSTGFSDSVLFLGGQNTVQLLGKRYGRKDFPVCKRENKHSCVYVYIPGYTCVHVRVHVCIFTVIQTSQQTASKTYPQVFQRRRNDFVSVF